MRQYLSDTRPETTTGKAGTLVFDLTRPVCRSHATTHAGGMASSSQLAPAGGRQRRDMAQELCRLAGGSEIIRVMA